MARRAVPFLPTRDVGAGAGLGEQRQPQPAINDEHIGGPDARHRHYPQPPGKTPGAGIGWIDPDHAQQQPHPLPGDAADADDYVEAVEVAATVVAWTEGIVNSRQD